MWSSLGGAMRREFAPRRGPMGLRATVVWIVVCALLGYPCLALSSVLVRTAVPALGAAYGWSGEEGTLTVTDHERVSGTSAEWVCFGDFTPASGAPARKGIGVEVGRRDAKSVGITEEARLVPGREDADWLLWGDHDRAYSQVGFGTGAATPIFVLLVPNLLSLLLGVGCASTAVRLCLRFVAEAPRRLRRARGEREP